MKDCSCHDKRAAPFKIFQFVPLPLLRTRFRLCCLLGIFLVYSVDSIELERYPSHNGYGRLSKKVEALGLKTTSHSIPQVGHC